jgi:hypothetical protein
VNPEQEPTASHQPLDQAPSDRLRRRLQTCPRTRRRPAQRMPSCGSAHCMSRILVGITSWTEKTLVESGRFYPPDVHTAEARLRFYVRRFPVVEVDSSYPTTASPPPATRAFGRSGRPTASCSTSRPSVSSPSTRRRRTPFRRTSAKAWRRERRRTSTTRTCQQRFWTSCGSAFDRRSIPCAIRTSSRGAVPVRALVRVLPLKLGPDRGLRRAPARGPDRGGVPQQVLVRGETSQ